MKLNKILKTSIIFSCVLLLTVILVYISIPTFIKQFLPLITKYTIIDKIEIDSVYYSSILGLRLDNISLEVKSEELRLDIQSPNVILNLNPKNLISNPLDINITSVYIEGNINLENFLQKQANSEKQKHPKILLYLLNTSKISDGVLNMDFLKFQKMKFENINAKFNYSENILEINDIYANIFNGKIRGNGELECLKDYINYTTDFNFKNIEIFKVLEILNLKNIDITGEFDGILNLSGTNKTIKDINIHLTSTEKGGRISIKEKELLQILPRKKENLNLLIKHLQDFSYTESKIDITSLNNTISVRLIFTGKEGTKDLEFIFHDILE